MSLLEANKDVVRRYVDAFNRADLDTLKTIFAPDATVQGVLGAGDMGKVIALWSELLAAFANQLHVEEMIAEGDCVAVRYTERGTFRGVFRGHAPMGRPSEVVAMEWFTVHAGKIQQRWGTRDFAAIARQTGIPLK